MKPTRKKIRSAVVRTIHIYRDGLHEGTVRRATHRDSRTGTRFVNLYSEGGDEVYLQHAVNFEGGEWRYDYEKPWKRLPADIVPDRCSICGEQRAEDCALYQCEKCEKEVCSACSDNGPEDEVICDNCLSGASSNCEENPCSLCRHRAEGRTCGSCQAGILVSDEGKIERCDVCALFETDEDAAAAVRAQLKVLHDEYQEGADGTVADAHERIRQRTSSGRLDKQATSAHARLT